MIWLSVLVALANVQLFFIWRTLGNITRNQVTRGKNLVVLTRSIIEAIGRAR